MGYGSNAFGKRDGTGLDGMMVPDKTRFLFSLLDHRSPENQIDQQQEGEERQKKQTKQ